MYSGNGQHYGNKTAYFGWPAGTEENDPTNTKDMTSVQIGGGV